MTSPLPPVVPGLTIGLLGGSFDPPHEGHVLITRIALKRLGLDRVWWMVSPGNPLKARGPADITRRMLACRALVRHPRVYVTDIEAQLGLRHTAATLRQLRARMPQVRFVWLMGADNLAGFHRWRDWESIMRTVPVAVLARPQNQVRAGLSPAARRFARWRWPQSTARALPHAAPPCWTMLIGPTSAQSSTALRSAGHWP